MKDQIVIAPNRPLYIALIDPKGVYDFDREKGVYQTTDGRTLELPEKAVVALNLADPAPGEEIRITKIWSGKHGDFPEWTVCLSVGSEQARADAGEPDSIMRTLEATTEAQNSGKSTHEPPTPIRRPARAIPAPVEQPRLFDSEKGTGTYGPAAAIRPRPQVAPARRSPPAVIPWNVAFREVSEWVSTELRNNNLQWGDVAQQAMVCTVLIAEARAKRIGPWEREK